MKVCLAICLAALSCLSLFATERPAPGDLNKYLQDGTFETRASFVKQIGNHRVRKDLAQRMLARLQRASAQPNAPLPAPLPNLKGMPTKGTNKVLVLLVDFPDYNHVNQASLISSKLFGDGVPSEFPFESLRNYYRRSSYNQLEIKGSALGWYRMQHPRDWYTITYPDENDANRAVILEALQAFDATHDFSQYDNDGDGEVDYFAVIWAGPDDGWGNFWWGYKWDLYNPITLDGVSFRTFSWQWESQPVGSAFDASTIIHETGHALGVPDYYDYDLYLGPGGGVGGLDIMDGGRNDHNAFSKYMLEWLEPVGISAGATNITLQALGGTPEAVMVMSNLIPGTAYSEYFLVENRTQTNNDVLNDGSGLLIWHIDATPNANGDDFLYDNSYAAHKLLRLMEADGLEEIETGSGYANSGDYWTEGQVFGSSSAPNSHAYDGTVTGVLVDSISAAGQSMNLRVAVEGMSGAPRILWAPASFSQSAMEGTDPDAQTLRVWASSGTLSYAISDDASWLSVSPGSGSSSGSAVTNLISYSVAGLQPGTYEGTITLTAPEAGNSPQSIPVSLTVMGTNIADALDATSLAWISGGPSPWFDQTGTAHDNQDAAQSGPISSSQTNWIETTLQGPGLLTFWWKVSSKEIYDHLDLLIDDEYTGMSIDGEVDWRQNTAEIPSGTHRVRWAYSKDGEGVSGLDAAWLDQVTFTTGGNLPQTLLSTDFNAGLPAGWRVVDNASMGAVWRFEDLESVGNQTGGSGGFAIANSDFEGPVNMDTELVTPILNFTGYTNIVLEFKSHLKTYSAEIADVDYRINGGSWMNLWTRTVDDSGPRTYRLSIPPADNQSAVEVRFHFWNAYYDLYWGVDDVRISGTSTAAPPLDFAAAWRNVWETFDLNYSRFGYKGINWAPVFEANRSSFAAVADESAFAAQLNTLLQTLSDWQVMVKRPDGLWTGYNGVITNNFPSKPFTTYTMGSSYADLNNAGVISHALVYGTIGHIVVNTLEDTQWSQVSDASLDSLFQLYESTEGLVLDLRPTADGNATNALRIASRFTDLPRVYGYTQTRNAGADHASFGGFVPKLLQPASGIHYSNKVACLIGHKTAGTAEWLALMMRVCPQVTLIGDRTRGSAGASELFSESALNIQYTIPREMPYDADRITFQDRGISPQIAVAAQTGSYDPASQRDYVLERGVAWLRRPSLKARTPAQTDAVTIEWQSGLGSTYTLLTSTNMLPDSWQLASGSSSNRAGTGGILSYTNTSPGPKQFYKIQVGP